MRVLFYLSFYLLLIVCLSCRTAPSNKVKVETGKASFYSNKHNGKKTASGEIYRSGKLTAAHKTLPFGTMVRVTNLSNRQAVIVKINDRGPYAKGRIIDLSRSAAKKIGMIQQGVVKVKIEYTLLR